jgi:hypothetical protein
MKPEKPTRSGSPKKAYAPPRLSRYGNFKDIVQGGGGTKNEPHPNNPASRA